MPHPASLNAQLLKDTRKLLGWTQEDLAGTSGLSVRVIAKCEAGEQVSSKTVIALVDALRGGGSDIEERDLASNPEVLARQFLTNYSTHQAHCVEHSRKFLSPDIVAFVYGDPATNPIAGTYQGIEEFDALWKKFFAIFVRDGGSLGDNPEIRCIGNEVLAWGHEFIRVPEAGPQPSGFVSLRMRFQAGLMIYFEDHYEAYGMMRRLQEWAREFPDANWLNELDRDSLLSIHFQDTASPPAPRDL